MNDLYEADDLQNRSSVMKDLSEPGNFQNHPLVMDDLNERKSREFNRHTGHGTKCR